MFAKHAYNLFPRTRSTSYHRRKKRRRPSATNNTPVCCGCLLLLGIMFVIKGRQPEHTCVWCVGGMFFPVHLFYFCGGGGSLLYVTFYVDHYLSKNMHYNKKDLPGLFVFFPKAKFLWTKLKFALPCH